MRALRAAPLLVVLAVALSACGSSSSGGSAATTGSQELCANLRKFDTAVSGVQKLDPSTVTSNQLTAAIGAVRDGWSHVQGSMHDAPRDVQSDLARAYGVFRPILQSQPPDAAPADILTAVQPGLKAMSTSIDKASSTLGCA